MKRWWVAAVLVAVVGCDRGDAPEAALDAQTRAPVVPTSNADARKGEPDGASPTNDAGSDAHVAATPASERAADAGRGVTRGHAGPTAAHGAENADAGATCGLLGAADCPMQSWMKRNIPPVVPGGDFPAIARALDDLAALSPPDYPNWASISRDGAAAARIANVEAVRAACRGCHEQYRGKYLAEDRARPVP